MTQENGFIYTGTISAPENVTVDFKDGGLVFDIDGELVPWQVAKHANELLAALEFIRDNTDETMANNVAFRAIAKARGNYNDTGK